MARNLRDALRQPAPPLSELLRREGGLCALRQPKPCCQGLGYRVFSDASFVRAEVCDCVRQCPVCLGKCLRPVASPDGNYDPAAAMEACVPHAPHRVIRALNEARVPSHYAEATLENFTNLSGNGAEVLRGLRQWLSSFVLGQSKGIILSGAVGVGKTHLLTSVTKTLAMRGVNVRFVDFYQLLAEIRDGYASKQSELDIIQPLVDLDVLVIDEMGKGPSTDWPVSILDQIVDGRDKRRMPIIASTNYTLGPSTGASSRAAIDLEGPAKQFSPDMFTSLEARVGARIYSRLLGMCHTVELKGKDWRRNPSRAGTGTGSAR